MKNQQIILLIVTAVVVGGAAFFGGMKYQETKAATPGANRQYRPGGGMRQGMGRGMGGAVVGEIIASDDKSLTVKFPDGSVTAQNVQLNPMFRMGSPMPSGSAK